MAPLRNSGTVGYFVCFLIFVICDAPYIPFLTKMIDIQYGNGKIRKEGHN